MNRLVKKQHNASLRQQRTRSHVRGSSDRPRLSVHISNRNVTAQIIDDSRGMTLVYASTIGQSSLPGTMTNRAQQIGEQIATKAKSAKISKVVFDKGSKLYHGRMKVLADAAREKGLEF